MGRMDRKEANLISSCFHFFLRKEKKKKSEISLHSSVGKESACNAGGLGLIPGSGRYLGEGNGNPLQDSCLENPMDRGAARLQPMGSQELDMT